MDAIKAAIGKAEGFLVLGMGVDAWESLEALHTEGKIHPRVLELRLEILVHEKEWEKAIILGDSLASLLPNSAAVWMSLARSRTQLGHITEAKEALARAFGLDEKLRLPALSDALLAALL